MVIIPRQQILLRHLDFIPFCFNITEYSARCWDLPLAAVRWWLKPGSLRTREQSTRLRCQDQGAVMSRGHHDGKYHYDDLWWDSVHFVQNVSRLFSLMTIFPQYFLCPVTGGAGCQDGGRAANTGQADCQHFKQSHTRPGRMRIAASIIRNYGSHLSAHVCLM